MLFGAHIRLLTRTRNSISLFKEITYRLWAMVYYTDTQTDTMSYSEAI